MTSYSFLPSATICPWLRNNVIPHLSSLSAFSDINFLPDAPTRSRSRAYIVLASADGEKKQREVALGIESELLDLKSGHPISENPQKTFPKVLERKSNPDVTYLEIEKSIKSVSINNKGKRKSNGLIREVMRGEGKRDISPIEPVRLGSDAKMVLMESGSKDVTHKVLLQRPYSMQKQACDFHGFAPPPTAPHFPSKKKEDSVKTSLEDTVLQQRPEARRIDDNLRKSPSDRNTKEIATEDSLLSKTDTVNTYAAADKRGKVKRERGISMNRPTMAMNPIGLTSYEMDHRKLHGRTEDENHLQRSVSESKEDARSFPSREPQTMSGSVPSSTKSDKMSLYQTDFLADGVHAIIFERNAQISDQKNGMLLQPVQEGKDDDWARAESFHKSGEREEVELISCFKSGFAVSFGSLIGFLPHRDLGPQRKYFSFEAWLQEKGPDTSTFKKGIKAECSSIFEVLTTFLKNEGNIQSAEKEHAAIRIEECQRLLNLYNRDRTKFLSYFVGQKTRARVTSIDRKSGRLLLSEKLIQGRDFGKKKENLMDKLNIGDVVTCKITSTSYFGVFVELEGVAALIHRSELSWDPVWDVHSFLKVGEIVKAKVCHLDHSLQRINLSLKKMQTDQVVETLESVINEENCPTKGNLQLQEFENEWPEVESLIRELELVGGIHSVSKGQLLLCPRWAPKFQVSLCDSHGIQYKILAKSGYRVQQIIIQASLNRDGIKLAIHHALHDMYKQFC